MVSKQQGRDAGQRGGAQAGDRGAEVGSARAAGAGNAARVGQLGLGRGGPGGGGGFGWGAAAGAALEGEERGAPRAAAPTPRAHGRGAGAHAGACGCVQCVGGGGSARHPDFREVYADGSSARPGGGPGRAPADEPQLGAGPAAPTFGGQGEAASAGAVTTGKHPDFPEVYGQTWFAIPSLPAAPRVRFTVEKNILPWKEDYTVKVSPVAEPAGCSWPVLCTPENNDGYKIDAPQPEYPDLDHYVIVSSSAAEHIMAAEDQHVQDLDAGWLIAAIHLADGINRVAAGEGASGADPSALQSALAEDIVSELGAYGQTIKGAVASGGSMESPVATAMTKAFAASKTQRDSTGGHSFPLQLYTAHVDQGKVASMVTDDKAPPATASSAVVNTDTLA